MVSSLTGHIDAVRFCFEPPSAWKLEVLGWFCHLIRPIKEISVRLGTTVGEVDRYLRADVAAMLPEVSHAANSGFVAKFEISELSGASQRISLTAILDSGERISSEIPIDLKEARFEGELRSDSKEIYGSEEARQSFRRRAALGFAAFMSSTERISFGIPEKPVVSIVLVLYNQAELTYTCLRSLKSVYGVDFEVIVVDNNSTDKTADLLSRVDGLTLIVNKSNTHFLAGANQGSAAAKGKYLLFLNNDTDVLPDAVKNTVEVLDRSSRAGAAGARIIRPDGRLQEAGCYILRSGATFGFGIGDNPAHPRYSVERVVDYCSGAFLLTRRALFEKVGGFDTDYAPAYFEDVDYCLKLRELGYDTVYVPTATIFHAEKSSSAKRETAEYLTSRNRALIRKKHREYLRTRPFPPLLPASSKKENKILLIDNALPDSRQGQGFPRAELLLKGLLERGFDVTVLALNQRDAPAQHLMPNGVTLVTAGNDGDLEEKLTRHALGAKTIIVSRSPNMERCRALFDFVPTISKETKIIFDAEAIFAGRAILEAEILDGVQFSPAEKCAIMANELELAKGVTSVLAVSELEAKAFRDYGIENVKVLSHVASPRVVVPEFELRSGLLMVGPLLEMVPPTPNVHGLRWFIDQIFPLILSSSNGELSFSHAGRVEIKDFTGLSKIHVRSYGLVQDLSEIYARHRVFVAPIRYGAGVPIKIIEAAAAGIPCVATPLLASQLGWSNGRELLVADSAQEFAEACMKLHNDKALWTQISKTARERVQLEYSKEQFESVLSSVLS